MAKIGKVDTKKEKRVHVYEDTHAEWGIPEFSSISEYNDDAYYDSPTFSVGGVSFFFKMYPRNSNHPDSACFLLKSGFIRDFLVEYKFGLKKLDGSVKELQGGIMKGKETYSKPRVDLCISEVLHQKSEQMPGDVLTVTCTLKPDIIHSTSTETTDLDKPKALKLIRLDKLSENFKDLFSDTESCDVSLKVKDKEYKAHRSVLIARSSVFAANFKHDTLERQTGVITIPDCDPDSFQEFLEYLYCGKLEQLSLNSALNLYYTSDKYNVEELKSFCVEYLMQCLTLENMCEVVVFADKHEETALFSAVQEFFNTNLRKILVTEEWECLLKRDYRLANKLMIEMSKMKFKEKSNVPPKSATETQII